MNDVLARMTELYVDLIPKALSNCKADKQLYGALVLYDMGITMSIEDQAKFSRTLYLLEASYRDSMATEYGGDLDEFSRMAYLWGDAMNHASELVIDSTELHELLVNYATAVHSDQFECEGNEIDLLGNAIASACLELNERGWKGNQFTSDFVVFTDRAELEDDTIGLAHSVPKSWLDAKQSSGLLLWLS